MIITVIKTMTKISWGWRRTHWCCRGEETLNRRRVSDDPWWILKENGSIVIRGSILNDFWFRVITLSKGTKPPWRTDDNGYQRWPHARWWWLIPTLTLSAISHSLGKGRIILVFFSVSSLTVEITYQIFFARPVPSTTVKRSSTSSLIRKNTIIFEHGIETMIPTRIMLLLLLFSMGIIVTARPSSQQARYGWEYSRDSSELSQSAHHTRKW